MKNFLLALFCLLITACSSGNPAEDIVKKAVEAFHNNDIDGVKKYYDISEEYAEQVQDWMDNNREWLWDKVEIEKSVMRTTYDGVKDGKCYVLANVTLRNGETTRMEFRVEKKGDGTWIIEGDPEKDPSRFENDITQTADTPTGKHPVLGNVLNKYQEMDVRYMEKKDIEDAMKDDIEEIIGNELPLGSNESQGITIARAVIHSVIPDSHTLRILFNLEPTDPDALRRYIDSNRTWGGGNIAFLYYAFESDLGIMKVSCNRGLPNYEVHALLVVRHNRIGMWKKLKDISMIDYSTYETLSRKH